MHYLAQLLPITVAFIVAFSSSSALEVRDGSDSISLQYDVSSATFQSFEDPQVLRKFIRNHGYVLNLPYDMFSQDVTAVMDAIRSGTLSSAPVNGSDEKLALVPHDSSPITTHTHSTTLKGGPSYTNVTVKAEPMHIAGICFTDGNSGSSGGSIQRVTTASSDCSSGKANSTDHVTGNQSKIRINVSAVVYGAKAKEVINGGRDDALVATACASDANGASANALLNTTLSFPVNQAGERNNGSTAHAFCQAGVNELYDHRGGGTVQDKNATSSSQSVAALTGMEAVVVCNGKAFNANQGSQVRYKIEIAGTKAQGQKFRGSFTVRRRATIRASCS